MKRRTLLAAAGAGLLPAPALRAQDFTGPLRIVVPFAPGGTSDILARLIAPSLQQRVGQNVVVENRPGAGGNIGADAVAKSRPDGTSLLLLDVSALATNPFLYSRMPFDTERDLAPVQMVIYAPYIMAVNNNLPVQTAPELAAWVRANPGRLNFAPSGIGTLTHIVGLSLASHWGGEITAVPYRGGAPATLDLAAGRIAMMFDAGLTGFQTARGNQARAFAVTTAQRNAANPDVPTWREGGVDAEMSVWQAVFVPSATPRDRRDVLNAAINRALGQEALRKRLGDLGADRILSLNVAESEAYLAAEVTRWEALLKR